MQRAGRGEKPSPHPDQQVARVAAQVVVPAGDKVADGISQQLLVHVVHQPNRCMAIVLVTLIAPGVEVIRLGLPRMHMVPKRVQVVELLVVEAGAAQRSVHRAHHEVRHSVNRRIHRDQEAVRVMEVAQPFAVNPVSRVGKDGTAVPSFIDCPSVGAFGEVIGIHQFQVLAGKAEFTSYEARKTPKHAAAGLGCSLYRICRTFL